MTSTQHPSAKTFSILMYSDALLYYTVDGDAGETELLKMCFFFPALGFVFVKC